MTTFDPIESLASIPHEFGEHGGVNMSIETSTTFTVMEASTMPEIFQGEKGPDDGGCFLYGRHFNPTVYALGKQLAALEGGEAGYCTASGMAAISSVTLQLCNQGDHIICSNTVYGGTFALFNELLPLKMGLQVSFVDISDLKAVENAIQDNTKMIYTESMANPTLVVADIAGLSAIAKKHNKPFVVDNTFSPMIFSPLQLGADIVIYSMTKFINGTSDIIAGAVIGKKEFVLSLMDLHLGPIMLFGPTMDPRQAYSISMRLPHLGLRIKEHSRRGMYFAKKLEALNLKVIYPGLENHTSHQLLKEQSNAEYGFGGVISLELESSDQAAQLLSSLQQDEAFGMIAVSLGSSETLMSCSALTTSSELSDEELRAAGISPGLVRFSLGITGSLEQRWQQFERSLKKLKLI